MRWPVLRGLIPGRAAAALVASGLVGAGFSFAAIGRTVANEEEQLLQNRTTSVNTVLTTVLTQVSSPLTSAAAAVATQGPDGLAAAEKLAAPEGIHTLVLLEPASGGTHVAARLGTVKVTSAGVGGTPSAALASAQSSDSVRYVGVSGSTQARTVGLAVGLPAPRKGWTLYAELTLPPLSQIVSSPQIQAFPDIDFALYVGSQPTDDSLILATTANLPLRGTRGTDVPSQGVDEAQLVASSEAVTSSAGPGDLLVVVAARAPLAGPITDLLPWVVAGTILLTAVLFAVVVEAALRRRDQAVRDSRRLAEANTELESALAAVEEAEKNFRRLFDDHPNPMWVYDAETLQFLAVNHAAVARYGYSRVEFLAMRIVDIRPAEDVPLVMGVIGQKSPTMLHTGPWRHRLKDGRVIWVEITSHEQEFAGRRARLTLARDVTDRVGLEEQLRHQAFHDPLTNLPNRALLSDRLDHAIARARRQSERCAVLLLDLDDFKGINDSRGHGAGDALLVEVAYRVVAALRESDTAARLGGDEFAVLIEDAEDIGAVIAAAERLIDELSLPYEIEGHRIHTSVSIGIALGEGDSVSTIDLLRNADIAMYAAKAGGKNRWEIYERSRHFGVSDGLALQNELPRAILEGELAVVYQPQFDLRTRTIVGVEALVRWNHPERGLVTPDVFIPLAERTSLINQIDEWVLETSCRQVQRWKEAGLPPLRVAVNVSGRFLEDDDRLVTAVARTLETTGIRPSDVEIELTESVAVAQHERALAILRRLRQLRVQVAIDDFGTGYSAFARLRSFPPDRIKIDREFISGVDHDPNDAALVSAMIAMGHGIGLSVLAEGVETEAELEFLAAQGCDEVQGYLISRPLSVEALEDLLRHPERIRTFAAAPLPASLPAAG